MPLRERLPQQVRTPGNACLLRLISKHRVIWPAHCVRFVHKHMCVHSLDPQMQTCCCVCAGHLHTFDFHAQRATLAAKEFAEHGLRHVVTVGKRDIEQEGFPEEMHGRIDAVFLDVPGPWRVGP